MKKYLKLLSIAVIITPVIVCNSNMLLYHNQSNVNIQGSGFLIYQ